MIEERRSETPVADTKLRSEINISVLLQGAMLLVLSGIGGLLYDINNKIEDLRAAQGAVSSDITSLKADVTFLKMMRIEDEKRLRALEIDSAKHHAPRPQ